MLDLSFIKLQSFSPATLIKRGSNTEVFSCEYCEILKNTYFEEHCKRLLLLTVIFSQENNHMMQRYLDLPEPKFHKKLACVMLVHSPQTTFHRKIIYNFVWIYLGKSSRSDVFCKKVFLGISQNSQENTCARASFLIKLQAFAKKEALVQVFSVNFVKYVIARFFKELLRWLLLSGPTLHKEIT